MYSGFFPVDLQIIFHTYREEGEILKYKIDMLDDQTWIIEEYDEITSVYMYLLTGTMQGILIDTGMGAIPLYDICRELTHLPITVLLTHGHVDHIGGTNQFKDVFLHKEDWNTYQLHSGDLRKQFSDIDLPPVKERVSFMQDGNVFNLGERTVQIIHTPGHSLGSVCILDQERKWLFTGDTCCKAHVLLQMDYSASLETYSKTMKNLLSRSEEYNLTWPGHHEKPVEIDVLKQFLEATEGILAEILHGNEVEIGRKKTNLLLYKDIGIIYPKETDK